MMRVIICLIFLGIVTAQKHPGDDKEPKKPRRRLTPKGTGSRADWAFCTKDKPCGEREGDCDGNDQCEAGLECGVDNCQAFHKDAHRLADCCVRKSGPASKCVVDTPLRLLTHYVDLGEDVTPESCIEACSILEKPGPEPKIPGYVFAGVQAGNQCYCGNSNISSTWHAPASECNMPCSGNSNEICGGNMRMNVFETGIPWFTGSFACPDNWISWKSFCYKRIEQLLTWNDAQQNCVAYGGNLASVQSAQENDFIFGITMTQRTWIGGNDIENDGTWVWNDGTPWSYENWGMNEPNNHGGNEECLNIGHHGNEWNDAPCSNEFNSICKMESRQI